MKKIILEQAKSYDAPKHFNYISYRLSGKDETGAQKFSVGISHFLPGGGAEFSASPAEKFYYVLDGLITVKTEQEEITLRSGEGVYIGSDEGRSIINNTHLPASMLVAMSY